MDYNLDNMDAKQGKMQPSQEDRLDSGLDSIKDEELMNDFQESLTFGDECKRKEEYDEPWREAVTEDGDT